MSATNRKPVVARFCRPIRFVLLASYIYVHIGTTRTRDQLVLKVNLLNLMLPAGIYALAHFPELDDIVLSSARHVPLHTVTNGPCDVRRTRCMTSVNE